MPIYKNAPHRFFHPSLAQVRLFSRRRNIAMPPFIAGRELSRRFYIEAVRPILDAHVAALPHAAALIGSGSDVLGFDDELSTDHDWGPALSIFLRDKDAGHAAALVAVLREQLPHLFHGYPVDAIDAPDEPGTRIMCSVPTGPVNHRVSATTLRAFVWEHLAYDIDQPIAAADWLTFPAQKLRAITAGPLHHDGIGELTALRERLAWYPRDVWLYLLAAGWQRIAQEEHLMPRAGHAGDELGSSLIGARLVRDIMGLCFLIERQYAPYPKWFGTAFKRLGCAGDLTPLLWRTQQAGSWQARAAALCAAYEQLARAHNALGITEPLPTTVSSFHSRPFTIIHGERFANALRAQIADPGVARIAARRLIGSIDQISDSTDIRSDAAWRPLLRTLYNA
jgi:hypothetical protein